MCLYLKEDSKLQIATKDIVCYKRIKIVELKDLPHSQLQGKLFHGHINGIKTQGIISIHEGDIYFCTNQSELNGISCPNKYGYTYSWQKSLFGLKDIIIDDETIVLEYITPYRKFPVQLGKTYYSELIKDDYVVEIGLHSYASWADAWSDGPGEVVKCIIPKGSEYYEGDFSGFKSYASNCLQYLHLNNLKL